LRTKEDTNYFLIIEVTENVVWAYLFISLPVHGTEVTMQAGGSKNKEYRGNPVAELFSVS
jgi:hypothetical protein